MAIFAEVSENKFARKRHPYLAKARD